jgi:hypothetical protein
MPDLGPDAPGVGRRPRLYSRRKAVCSRNLGGTDDTSARPNRSGNRPGIRMCRDRRHQRLRPRLQLDKISLSRNQRMPTPYAYTQWCFSCENVKRHEVARRAISLGGRAIAHHGKMAKKPPEELIIPWSSVRSDWAQTTYLSGANKHSQCYLRLSRFDVGTRRSLQNDFHTSRAGPESKGA